MGAIHTVFTSVLTGQARISSQVERMVQQVSTVNKWVAQPRVQPIEHMCCHWEAWQGGSFVKSLKNNTAHVACVIWLPALGACVAGSVPARRREKPVNAWVIQDTYILLKSTSDLFVSWCILSCNVFCYFCCYVWYYRKLPTLPLYVPISWLHNVNSVVTCLCLYHWQHIGGLGCIIACFSVVICGEMAASDVVTTLHTQIIAVAKQRYCGCSASFWQPHWGRPATVTWPGWKDLLIENMRRWLPETKLTKYPIEHIWQFHFMHLINFDLAIFFQ